MLSGSSAFSDSARSVAPSLWRNSDFRSLWAGQTASQLGEQASLVVLPLIAVLTLNVDAGQLGVLRAVEQAPQLLLTLFVGVWVDKWQTPTVMVLSDLGRALALSAVAVVAVTSALGLPVLLASAFAVGVLSVFFNVAYQASLVRLVKRDQLLQGNSAIEASRSAAQMGGPALGGAMTSLLSAPFAAASSALFFGASFLAIAHVRDHESVPQHPGGPRRMWRQILEGLRFVAGNGLLRTVCLASAAFQLSFAALMTAYLLFLPRELHLSGTVIGLALAATGPGALVGALLAARLPSRLGYGPVLVVAAVIGNGVMLCLSALRGSSWTAICALIAINLTAGASGQLINVTIMAVRQAVTPDFMQGRVAATITFAGMGMSPLGALLGGLLADRWGLRTALLIAAAGMMLSPVFMVMSPLGRLGRTLPTPDSTHDQAH
ncbi:putative MFS family arabinose efflux permease [Micromonospora pisi]|uniref:Putative MFS family arabinose efflux permease n=1 Tax=Micromonospora pisi TaxID=589240 RepID=A0A495JXQ3_9ACTN|nr:MFS transporter [Micromonospora pisi]RKR92979.1 putative MFS family arabinose efflux permease [Micromonospora pisi]